MNSNNPKISVVIPAHNEEKYLPACLYALQRQTIKDFEVIVVDNNSTDQTAQIAKKFEVKVLKENKVGITFARDTGFSAASSSIIARTDADTVVSPQWLETIYEIFKKHPETVAITGLWKLPDKPILNLIYYIYLNSVFNLSAKLMLGHILLLGSNMAIQKNAWEKIKDKIHSDDTLVHEDIDLSCHLAEIGRLVFVPQLETSFSPRKLQNNILRGLWLYLVKYPIRYFRTVFLHHSILHSHKIASQR